MANLFHGKRVPTIDPSEILSLASLLRMKFMTSKWTVADFERLSQRKNYKIDVELDAFKLGLTQRIVEKKLIEFIMKGDRYVARGFEKRNKRVSREEILTLPAV